MYLKNIRSIFGIVRIAMGQWQQPTPALPQRLTDGRAICSFANSVSPVRCYRPLTRARVYGTINT